MEQTRDARRGTGRTNNFSSVKRKTKQCEVPKFFSEGKLNNGGVKTMVRTGKASSRYQDRKTTCLLSNVHGDDHVAPCSNKKIKLHKIVNDCNSVDHSPVPRKLRSAMKKRNRESLSPPLQGSETLNHTMGGSESPKAIYGSSKTSKMEMKQGDHITKDEEEVVEALYSLASMFSTVDTPDKIRVDGQILIPEEKPLPLGVAGLRSMPALSARLTTIDQTSNPPSNAARLQNEDGTLKDENLNKTFVPQQQPRLTVHETFARVDRQALCLQSCDFGVPPQQNLGSRLDWSKQLTDRKPLIESNPALHSVIQQEQSHSTIEAQKEGRTLWPGLFSSGAQLHNPPLPSAIATQYPSWLDTPKLSVRPSSYQNGVSNEKVLSDAAERKSWKKCATHVHIGRLIKDLNNSERNDSQLSEPNTFRPNEGLKQENLAFGGNVNEFSRVISGVSAVEMNLNEARNGALLSHRLRQDQHYAAAVQSGACDLQKQSFNFLSLSTDGGGHVMEGGNNRSNKGKNGLDSFPQLHIPYINSHLHNQNTRLVSLPQTCYSTSTSAYGDQLFAASAKQVQLHVPPYRGIQYSANAQVPPCWTNFQQEKQVQQQMWAAQLGYKPIGLTSSTMSQLPTWKNGGCDSSFTQSSQCSLVPFAANNTIVSPSLTALGIQGSLKYMPFSSQQEQFMAMTSSLGHASARRQQNLSFLSGLTGHEKNGGDFCAGDSELHSRLLCKEHL